MALLAVLGAAGCSSGECTVRNGADGTTTIECPDGTSAVVRDGKDGSEGRDGADGKDGSDGRAGTDGKDAPLVRVDQLGPGGDCPSGGVAVHVGTDADGDGVLDDEEIESTTRVCNGTDGEAATLVRVVPEAPGANCAVGGHAVLVGRDADRSGTLEDDEVAEVVYVCDGEPGRDAIPTLVRIEEEPAGANCANGGKLILSGPDTNGNGTLEDEEATSGSFVCNGVDGSDGQTALVHVTAEPPGLNCEHGGQAIRTGLDSNGDGVLDEEEVDTSSYVCHGAEAVISPGSTSSVMSDGWSVRCLEWSGSLCLRPQAMMQCVVCSAYEECGVWHDLTYSSSDEGWTAKNFCAIATGSVGATWSSGSAYSAVAPRGCMWRRAWHPLCEATRTSFVPPYAGTSSTHGLLLEDAYCGAFDSRRLQVECTAW